MTVSYDTPLPMPIAKNRVPFAASRCTRLVISRRLLSPPSVSKMMFLLMLPSSAAGFRSTALCSPATMHVPPLGPAFSLTHSFLSRSPCSLVSLSLHPLNRTSLSQHSWSKNTTFTCMLRSHTVLINTSIASDTSLCGTVPPHFHPIDPDLSTTRMISRLHRTALRSTSILGTIVSSTTVVVVNLKVPCRDSLLSLHPHSKDDVLIALRLCDGVHPVFDVVVVVALDAPPAHAREVDLKAEGGLVVRTHKACLAAQHRVSVFEVRLAGKHIETLRGAVHVVYDLCLLLPPDANTDLADFYPLRDLHSKVYKIAYLHNLCNRLCVQRVCVHFVTAKPCVHV
eukprot:jgi/Antlo1/1005/2287